jgi:hypothetical protein
MAHPGGRQAPRHAPVGTNALRRDAQTGRFYRDGQTTNNSKQQQQQQQAADQGGYNNNNNNNNNNGGGGEAVEGALPPGSGYGFGRTSAPNFGGGFAASVRPSGAYYPCSAPGARCF